MTMAVKQTRQEKLSFTSSIAAEVWSPKPNTKAYEWWYFDALSDDGRDAVVIIFSDNFIFSPRYNRRKGEEEKGRRGERELNQRDTDSATNSESPTAGGQNPKSKIQNPKSEVPAIAFVYYRNGKPLYRAVQEFEPPEFSAAADSPSCTFGENFFRFESAPYGSGYFLSIKTGFRKNSYLEAQFEWLAIESDFLPGQKIAAGDFHLWNLAVSRADVSGRIKVSDAQGKELEGVQFRGTGYHDHNFDNCWLPEMVKDWQWGRAHFTDATAVFYHYRELEEEQSAAKILTIRDGRLLECDAEYEEQQFTRDFFGLKYPQRLRLVTEDGVRLRVKQTRLIDSSFCYLRFLSEMTLTLRDGKPRKSVGLTEYLKPKALKYRWLDWLVNLRSRGRGGR
jgi:carotenoid 1,2-hydratase